MDLRWAAALLALATVVTTRDAVAAALVVDDDGVQCPDAKHTTIQDAVDAAADGDTVAVCAGEYRERVRVGKPLRLVGARAGVDARTRQFVAESESVIVSPTPLLLMADDITVDGLMLRVRLEEDLEGQGIFTYGSGHTIVNNLIEDNEVVGLALTTIGGKPVTIAQNQFRGRLGIAADGEGGARNVVIRDNLFRNASVRLVDGETHDVRFADNVFRYEPEVRTACVDSAQIECRPSIYIALTRDITFERNRISGSGPYALRARDNEGLRIRDNTFADGEQDGVQLGRGGEASVLAGNAIRDFVGASVHLDDATGYAIEANRIERSGVGIDLDAHSTDNRVVRNVVSESRGPDCRDQSSGEGSAGTANHWEENVGATSLPVGLCADGTP